MTPTLSISSMIYDSAVSGAGITKTGNGLLQLSSANSTYSGGVNVQGGGIVIAGSSTQINYGDTLVAGPLGSGGAMRPGGLRALTPQGHDQPLERVDPALQRRDVSLVRGRRLLELLGLAAQGFVGQLGDFGLECVDEIGHGAAL
jgi:autotransporter-associated beta strand protein